ncbi:MAG: hypothetical protein Q7U47_04335 [Paludibacter sp.]|nr:hypothetical protein [Paludibacter sp.]
MLLRRYRLTAFSGGLSDGNCELNIYATDRKKRIGQLLLRRYRLTAFSGGLSDGS